MNRRQKRYRALQASVPGLPDMYGAIANHLADSNGIQRRILIVGGGGGREIELLASRGLAEDVTVVDPSPGNLAEARAAAAERAFSGSAMFHEASVADLPSVGDFDIATILCVLHTIRDWTQERDLLRSVRSRLNSSGEVLLADICYDSGDSIDAMVARYREHATELGTPQDLIELEVDAAEACQSRSRSRLDKLLMASGLTIARSLGTAHWYKCYVVEPMTDASNAMPSGT